jgi:RND family efflux transporter MFP subunit
MNVNSKTFTAIAGTLMVGGLTAAALVNITRAETSEEPRASARADVESEGNTSRETETARAKARGSSPITVEVQEPDKRTLNRLLRMPATLRADEQVDLYAKTSGYVSAVKVDIGSRVRKGDVLLEIDVPEMDDDLRQAEATLAAKRARLESAKAKAMQAELMIEAGLADQHRYATEQQLKQVTHDRVVKLHDDKVVTDQAFDEAKSELATANAHFKVAEARVAGARGDKTAAEAEVRMAEADIAVAETAVARVKTLMAYATIHAPFDGVITKRLVDHGAFVRSASGSATTPLLTIAKDDRIRLTLQIPESDAPFVRVGTTVDVHVKTLDKHVKAQVSRIASSLVPNTRTMQTEVDLDNAERNMAPGMYAHVAVQLESKPNAMMIPSKAIRVRGEDVFVLVADDGRARSVPIQIGYDDGASAEIASGLNGSERIIVESRGVCVAGTAVNAVAGKSDEYASRG